jgi:LPXTG-motif cell wall-anchored protein
MLPGWTFNVAGPEFPGGQQFVTDGSGRIILNGITAGFYTVTEQQQSGWAQTGLLIDGISQPVNATAVVEVKAGVSETDLPLVEVEFGNRAQSTVRVIKVVNDQVGTRNRAGWQFNLAGCGTSINGVTDANGEITWSNLIPAINCAYTVTEVDTEGFTVAPAQAQVVAPGPGETATVTFTNSRIPGETPTPTATPTNTPTPTQTPTNTPEPTETVAGEKTPGPGNISTPIPPDTGSGLMGTGTAGNLLMALIGLMAISGGMALFSLGRKRR